MSININYSVVILFIFHLLIEIGDSFSKLNLRTCHKVMHKQVCPYFILVLLEISDIVFELHALTRS